MIAQDLGEPADNGYRGPCAPDVGEAGYSLVEMLVALIILASVAVLMATFFGQLRTINRIGAQESREAETNALAHYLESAIAMAEPLPLVKANPRNKIFLQGSATSLRFVSIVRSGVRSFSVRQVELRTQDGDDSTDLLQRSVPLRVPQDLGGSAVTVVLAHNVSGLRFQYLGGDNRAHRDVWQDEWTALAMPRAVAFRAIVGKDPNFQQMQGYAFIRAAENFGLSDDK